MKLITHSANVQWLRSKIEEDYSPSPDPQGFGFPHGFGFFRSSIEIIANDSLAIERPSGRYLLPDGREVEEKDISVKTRFIHYGPEDVRHLVFLGVIKPVMEPLFFFMDDIPVINSLAALLRDSLILD